MSTQNLISHLVELRARLLHAVVAVLIAPFLRKFGAYTVPDFMAFRFGGNFARFIATSISSYWMQRMRWV